MVLGNAKLPLAAGVGRGGGGENCPARWAARRPPLAAARRDTTGRGTRALLRPEAAGGEG